MKTILVAVDFSDLSDRALEAAAELATRLSARLELVHVAPSPVTVLPPPIEVASFVPATPEETARLEEQVGQRVERVRRRNIATRSTIRMGGNVAHEIVARANEVGADLIVMGTHGRTGLRQAVLGSVAQSVLHLAHRPVLAVPAPAAHER